MSGHKTALARRWFDEVWNQRRPEIIDELLTPESVCHSAIGALRGPDEFKTKAMAMFVSAFPDLNVTVEGAVEEGDHVVVRWVATGTHTGPGTGIPPTGRPVNA